jgi:splicing factor 3B subunit 3
MLHLQSGQLNEYTERKEMSSDVICMGLGRVPPGEQRCRFLAVGLNDKTVRIISLDPNVSQCALYIMFKYRY